MSDNSDVSDESDRSDESDSYSRRMEEVEGDGLADLGPDYEYSVVGELAAYHYIFLWSQIS